MNGDFDKPDEVEQVEEDSVDSDNHADTVVMTDVDEDLALDSTAEVNVDELVAKLDMTDAEEAAQKIAVRKRLEAIREQKEAELDSTYNISLDDDV